MRHGGAVGHFIHWPRGLETDDSPAGAACHDGSHLFSVHPSDPGSVVRRMFALLATTMLKFNAPAGQSDLEREVDSIMGDSESPRTVAARARARARRGPGAKGGTL
jgi:hypothetical protein